LLGYYGGHTRRIDHILSEAPNPRCTEANEGLYLIEAQSRLGHFSVWFDAHHGFNVAKAEIQTREGDIDFSGRVAAKGFKEEMRLDHVEFKSIEGKWFPTAGRITASACYPDLGSAEVTEEVRFVRIDGHPDFERPDAFAPNDIREGASVGFVSEQVRHVWRAGQPVLSDDAH
jgi:hypothetical protein